MARSYPRSRGVAELPWLSTRSDQVGRAVVGGRSRSVFGWVTGLSGCGSTSWFLGIRPLTACLPDRDGSLDAKIPKEGNQLQRPRARLLLAFVPAILLLSACGAVGAASVNRSTSSPSISTAAASESPTAFAVVEPSPVATPVVATPVVAAPVQPADPYAAA